MLYSISKDGKPEEYSRFSDSNLIIHKLKMLIMNYREIYRCSLQ